MTEKAGAKKRGAKLKLTPEVQKAICKLIAEGNYLDTACKLVGINFTTFRRWILQGEHDMDGKFYEFSEAVKQAEAIAESERVRLILAAGKKDGDWKANAWYLERKYPEKWGRKERIDSHVTSEHTEKHEHLVEHQFDTDPETLDLVRQLWRRRQSLGEGNA